MGYDISDRELAKVRKMIAGTHGFTRDDGKRVVFYYVFKISDQKFGALWHQGLSMHKVDFLLNPIISGYPYAFIGTRKEVKEFCLKDIDKILIEYGYR